MKTCYNGIEMKSKGENAVFSSLKRNIVRTVVLSTLFLTLAVGTISMVVLGRSFYETYKASAEESIRQKTTLSLFSLENVRIASRQLSENEDFLEAIASETYNPAVRPVLNTFRNTSFGIWAVTLYPEGGPTYHTFNVAGVPTIAELKDMDDIDGFLASEEEVHLSIRTRGIALFYNDIRYDHDYGMMSYLVKLEGGEAGLMVVDVNPGYIYNTFFDYQNHGDFQGALTYIVDSEGVPLRSTVNTKDHRDYVDEVEPGETTLSRDRRYLLRADSYYSEDYRLVSLVPMRPFYQNIFYIGISLLFLIVVLNFVSYRLAKVLERRITAPLEDLKRKMESSEDQISQGPG